MSSLLGKLPTKYYPAVGILFFEACYIIYWSVTMFYLVFLIETDGGEKYRLFHAILGVHMLIAPAGIFYLLESHTRKPYTFIIWLFFGIFIFDLFAVLDVFIHLKKTIFDFWQIEAAAATWPFILSTFTLIWYIYILWTFKEPENKKIESKIKFRF